MIIMLFLFTLLIFPIKIGAKLYFLPEEGFLSIKFFLYRIFIFNLEFFISNDKIFLKLGKKKPSEFNLDLSNNEKSQLPFNPLIIRKVSIIINTGGSPVFVTGYSFVANIISSKLPKYFKNTKIEICSFPAYYKSGISIKGHLSVFTNILALFYMLIYYLISKLFTKKEKQNAIQQSN